jgi:hypothetical protein
MQLKRGLAAVQAEATWSPASWSKAARWSAVYSPPPNDSSSPAPTSGDVRSLSDGATTSDDPGTILRISAMRCRAFCMAMLPAATWARPGMQ